MEQTSIHWADIYADKIIREKGDKEIYTCASGITPSGTVHIGNFREVISVELVVRALRQKGKNVRFIYSWDEYDVFRKVPANMPNQETLAKYLRQPINLTPDPFGCHESYARHHEAEMESILPKVGIEPQYIYQGKEYRSSKYAEGMKTSLEHLEEIKEILNNHRTEDLEKNWWPVSVFCTKCQKDTTELKSWDGNWGIRYTCSSCGNDETIDLRKTEAAKLFWRVDWPMRWAYEGVDFEPAGKDHHSEGGSFDTAKIVVRNVFNHEPPVSFQYDFIGIKGRGGKISSSKGEVITLADVLEVYTPEIARFMFAGTRPNTEFSISFDLDVLKIYEDYDKTERIYFGIDPCDPKKAEKEKRIYELSQVKEVPSKMPYQISIRHLCNILQTHDGDVDAVINFLSDVREDQKERLTQRCVCAWNWVKDFAPEDFRFSLKTGDEVPIDLTENQKKALVLIRDEVKNKLSSHNEKTLAETLYAIAGQVGIETKELFKVMYQALVGKDQGPRLASFLILLGAEKVAKILKAY